MPRAVRSEVGPGLHQRFVATRVAERKRIVELRWLLEIDGAGCRIVSAIGVQQSQYVLRGKHHVVQKQYSIELLALRSQTFQRLKDMIPYGRQKGHAPQVCLPVRCLDPSVVRWLLRDLIRVRPVGKLYRPLHLQGFECSIEFFKYALGIIIASALVYRYEHVLNAQLLYQSYQRIVPMLPE